MILYESPAKKVKKGTLLTDTLYKKAFYHE